MDMDIESFLSGLASFSAISWINPEIWIGCFFFFMFIKFFFHVQHLFSVDEHSSLVFNFDFLYSPQLGNRMDAEWEEVFPAVISAHAPESLRPSEFCQLKAGGPDSRWYHVASMCSVVEDMLYMIRMYIYIYIYMWYYHASSFSRTKLKG